jgi:hypothetical protein
MDYEMNKNLIPISEGDYSTLIGMNGGCPESPDGTTVVYTRKPSLTDNTSSVWLCDADMANHRKVLDTKTGNHNGNSATFVENDKIVFRSGDKGRNFIHIVNIKTGETEYKIGGKEGHRAEKGKFPFSNDTGVYWLDCADGGIRKLLAASDMLEAIAAAGYVTNEFTAKLSHVQLNPSATKVMMRIAVEDAGGALLGCYDMENGKYCFIPNKPVHQLWYDDDSYMAVYQLHDGTRWVMEASRINRYSVTGEVMEVLGGIGNHIDGTPDRRYLVGDSNYPGELQKVFLYKKGEIEPLAELDCHNFQTAVWERKVHTNPSFSADGKRVYFNRPVSDEKTVAVYADVSEYMA